MVEKACHQLCTQQAFAATHSQLWLTIADFEEHIVDLAAILIKQRKHKGIWLLGKAGIGKVHSRKLSPCVLVGLLVKMCPTRAPRWLQMVSTDCRPRWISFVVDPGATIFRTSSTMVTARRKSPKCSRHSVTFPLRRPYQLHGGLAVGGHKASFASSSKSCGE